MDTIADIFQLIPKAQKQRYLRMMLFSFLSSPYLLSAAICCSYHFIAYIRQIFAFPRLYSSNVCTFPRLSAQKQQMFALVNIMTNLNLGLNLARILCAFVKNFIFIKSFCIF